MGETLPACNKFVTIDRHCEDPQLRHRDCSPEGLPRSLFSRTLGYSTYFLLIGNWGPKGHFVSVAQFSCYRFFN